MCGAASLFPQVENHIEISGYKTKGVADGTNVFLEAVEPGNSFRDRMGGIEISDAKILFSSRDLKNHSAGMLGKKGIDQMKL